MAESNDGGQTDYGWVNELKNSIMSQAGIPTASTAKQKAAAQEGLLNDVGLTRINQDPTNYTGGQIVRKSPIGVAPGYTARYFGQRVDQGQMADMAMGWDPTSSGIAARYDASDLDRFAGLSPETVSQVQAGLARAGLMPDKFAKGVWSAETGSAMQKILAYANQRGLLWQDALDEYGSFAEASGLASGASGPKFIPRLSNPDDLRATFKQVAYQRTGGNFMDDAAYDRMVASYQDAEMKSQRQAFDAQVGGGGTVVDAPSAQTFAEKQLQTDQTADVEANSFAGYGKVFESMMGSWQ